MSLWLLKMGAQVTGYSLAPSTDPSLFNELGLSRDMNSIFGDVRDPDKLKAAVLAAQPEIIIHMAAQPLVRYSYKNPVETYMTNVMGTVHLFEAARRSGSAKVVVNVTSDKCYENQERPEGYKEYEAMGGYDPYSSSKGCSELVSSAYRRSFFNSEGILLGSGRAGNVIGGGDWSQDRLVPDIIRAVIKNETVVIRSPKSTRPWQHVLEPVYGYLLLAEKMYADGARYAEGFNFGPSKADHCDVENIILKMNRFWGGKVKYEIVNSDKNPHEAHLLSLDCTKAEQVLGWKARWNLDQALQATIDWNIKRLDGQSVITTTTEQITSYQSNL